MPEQQPARDWQADWELCDLVSDGLNMILGETEVFSDYVEYAGDESIIANFKRTEDALFFCKASVALPYWMQQYKKKAECFIEVQTAYSGLLCEYHNFKETFRALARKSGATENRERTLLTAIKIAIDEYGQWQDKAAAAHIMFGALNEAITQVYGDVQMRGEDDAGSNSRVQGDQEDLGTQEG